MTFMSWRWVTIKHNYYEQQHQSRLTNYRHIYFRVSWDMIRLGADIQVEQMLESNFCLILKGYWQKRSDLQLKRQWGWKPKDSLSLQKMAWSRTTFLHPSKHLTLGHLPYFQSSSDFCSEIFITVDEKRDWRFVSRGRFQFICVPTMELNCFLNKWRCCSEFVVYVFISASSLRQCNLPRWLSCLI